MKVAWVGVLGAILGALITVIGQPYFMEWRYGPKEGIVHVDVSSIGSENIDSHLRSQISKYPVYIKIWHGEGPSAKGITIKIKSKQKLENFKPEREDEKVNYDLSKDGKTLLIDINELRKNSVNSYQIMSLGDPDLEKVVLISQGKLFEDVAQTNIEKSWYESDWFLMVVFTSVFVSGIAMFLYYSMKIYHVNYIELVKDKNLIYLTFIAIFLSTIPVVGILVPLALIFQLTKKISSLEKAIVAFEIKEGDS